jgi:hypothetical protein
MQEHPVSSTCERYLGQYPILECIAHQLSSVHLFRLATTSKCLWVLIKSTPSAWNNLNSKATCDRRGVLYRDEKMYPELLESFPGLTCDRAMPLCAGNGARHIETKPCVQCQRAACDECRIHVIYRMKLTLNAESKASDGEALRVYERFDEQEHVGAHALLQTWLSIGERLPTEKDDLRDAVLRHDAGIIIDRPNFNATSYGQLGGLNIEDWIDEPLMDNRNREFLRAEYDRIIPVCKDCFVWSKLRLKPSWTWNGSKSREPEPGNGRGMMGFEELHAHGVDIGAFMCQCTHRTRYLDRWLCILCARKELDVERDGYHRRHYLRFTYCACGYDD